MNEKRKNFYFLKITNKKEQTIYTGFFKTYEAACIYAYTEYNETEYFWEIYIVTEFKNHNMYYEWIVECQGGQDQNE